MDATNDKLLELLAKFKNDFPAYAKSVLKCTRVGEGIGLANLELNSQQKKLHELIERQKKETGRVRVVVLKSRRLGISTYVAGRFTHQLVFSKHRNANVTTHKSDASQTVFKIYKRYLDNLPNILKPNLKSNNTSKVEFDGTDCHIEIATANSPDTGRGSTYHFMHLSEVAAWENGAEICAGLLQTVSEAAGGIAGYQKGLGITRGPQLALIGEAGADAVIPLEGKNRKFGENILKYIIPEYYPNLLKLQGGGLFGGGKNTFSNNENYEENYSILGPVYVNANNVEEISQDLKYKYRASK